MSWGQYWTIIIQILIGALVLGGLGFVGSAFYVSIRQEMKKEMKK